MELNTKEKKFFELATVGGKTLHEAYADTYGQKNNEVLSRCLYNKKKKRPELFEQIEKYKKDLFDLAASTQREETINSARKNALLAIEKREKLRKIIEGVEQEEMVVINNGRVRKIKKKPSLSSILKAIDLDCKIAGHFSSDIIVKEEGGDPFIQAMKELAKVMASNKSIK